MDLLIKKATIIDPESDYHRQKLDVQIREGKIVDIDKAINGKDTAVLEAPDLCLLPGLIDVGTVVGDPGFEHREDMYSASKAAAAGGFTALACYPNTHPVVDSKSGVRYIQHNEEDLVVNFYPIGAVSEKCQGKDITEMIDMYRAGAVAFSDGQHPIQHNGMMMRALQYVKSFDGVILNHPHDVSIAGGGQLNEGRISTMLGMKGIPNMAEELMVQRDIYLAEYTDSKVHIDNISTAGAVEMVRKAKQSGVKVTASVPVLNLRFTDEELLEFNSNLKVLPPLRTENDRQALLKGIKDHTIDFITSNHVPLEEEAKKLEFSFAEFGAAGLETAFLLSWQSLKKELDLNLEDMVRLWSRSARKVLNIDSPLISPGVMANLTLFQPGISWQVDAKSLQSKSSNNPLIGEVFEGSILGIINGRKSEIFDR
jgi:dihydroorotase